MLKRAQTLEQLLACFQTIKRKLSAKSAIASDAVLRRITHSQWGVLRIVAQKDHVSIKDIAHQLSITSSAATQLVDGLVEHGHLKRKNNPDDRRSQLMELSAKTKKQMHLLRKSHLKRIADTFSALDDKELEEYSRLSAKIVQYFSSCSV